MNLKPYLLAGAVAVGLTWAFWPTSQEENIPVEPTPAVAPAPAIMPQQEEPVLTDLVVEAAPAQVEAISESLVETPQPETQPQEPVIETPVEALEEKLYTVFQFKQVGNPGEKRYQLIQEIDPWGLVRIDIDGINITYIGNPKNWTGPIIDMPQEDDPYENAKTEKEILRVSYENFLSWNEGVTYGEFLVQSEDRSKSRYENIDLEVYLAEIEQGTEIPNGALQEARDAFIESARTRGLDDDASYQAFRLFENLHIPIVDKKMREMFAPDMDAVTLHAEPTAVLYNNNLYLITLAKESMGEPLIGVTINGEDALGNPGVYYRTVHTQEGKIAWEKSDNRPQSTMRVIEIDGAPMVMFSDVSTDYNGRTDWPYDPETNDFMLFLNIAGNEIDTGNQWRASSGGGTAAYLEHNVFRERNIPQGVVIPNGEITHRITGIRFDNKKKMFEIDFTQTNPYGTRSATVESMPIEESGW